MGLLDWLFGNDKPTQKKKKKVFISFAIEDSKYRGFLVSQAKNSKTPFEFIDMSVKQAWPERKWKIECRKRIKQCDSLIVLLSKNTWHSSGSRWEIKCAREERLRIVGMHIKKDDKGAVPPELAGKKVIEWSWENLENFLN
jgi:MTH538 TIR-like domain (DUF1863)